MFGHRNGDSWMGSDKEWPDEVLPVPEFGAVFGDHAHLQLSVLEVQRQD